MSKISVVIPIYNEEGNILELYDRLIKSLTLDFSGFLYEFIFIDDGSADSSFNLLKSLNTKNPCVKIIQFSRNFGHHLAITAGLDYADGDFVVMMDGDLQDQPEEIIKLYEKLQDGFDVVYGVRKKKKFFIIKRFFSNIFLHLIRMLIKEKIEINTTIFRMMKKQVVVEVKKLRESNRYIVGLIGWVGFLHTSVPIEHGVRRSGKSKYNFSRQFALALDAIVSFSDYFLQIIVKVGFIFVLVSTMLGIYIIIKKIITGGAVLGWASLFTSILFIGGIQIIFLGVLGIYIGKLYSEVKRRPLYVIRNKIGINDGK